MISPAAVEMALLKLTEVVRIYLVTNVINGKVYVGKTKRRVSLRWIEHCSTQVKDGFLLHRAIKKYGKLNFKIEILSIAITPEEANIYEKLWVQILKSYKKELGYNLSLGGDGVNLTEEGNKKRSDTQKGRKLKPFTKEHRENISKAKRGTKMVFKDPQLRRIRLSKRLRGRKKTDKEKQRSSEARITLLRDNPEIVNALSNYSKLRWEGVSIADRRKILKAQLHWPSFNPFRIRSDNKDQVFCSKSCLYWYRRFRSKNRT